jgi:hypothetical protein
MALPKLNTSTFITTIPSTGKEVEYRPYLVKEEKILMMALETKDQAQIIRATGRVIESCITEDIDIDKLSMFDIEYLFLQLRSKSSGEIVELKLPCEVAACKHVNNFSVDLSKVEAPIPKKIEAIQLTSEIGVQMRWAGMKDLEDVVGDDLTSIDGATTMFAKLITHIFETDEIHNAADETLEDMVEFVESLNSEQFGKIAKFLDSTPSVHYSTQFECSKCKHETKIELKGLQSFFT